MKPDQIAPRCFSAYPEEGKTLALAHLPALRQTPLSLLPALLRDLKEYDWQFPAEQAEIANRISFIELRPACVAAFARITLTLMLESLDWIDQPKQFIEELSAYLWSSRQIDEYSRIAANFVREFQAAYPSPAPPQQRVVIAIVGCGATIPEFPLFEKLSPHGCLYTRVTPQGAPQAIAELISRRIANSPKDYAHWYIDGGTPWPELACAGLTQLVYPALAPVNMKILQHVLDGIQSDSGPELLRSQIGRLSPAELEANRTTSDPRLQRFVVSLLTEGSGTQIFSTSFVQWAARETLRRSQPQTLCLRFAPRQRQRAFNDMVRAASQPSIPPDIDPEGSLIDADMSAYYTWLEMNRLSGAAEACFLVWFENQSIALAAGPGNLAGARDDRPTRIEELVRRL